MFLPQIKSLPLALALLVWAVRANCQIPLLQIYSTDHHDGTVSVMAKNEGYVPITVLLNANLVNMRSTPALPAYLVVLPGKNPRLIATYNVEYPKSYSYRNYPQVELGIANDKGIDTTLVYGLPFKATDWKVVTPDNRRRRSRNGYHEYFFDVPDDTPVCAAREGVVAQLKQNMAANNEVVNYVIVFHDDGSYAWYQNLKPNKVQVKLGQHLAKGEILAYANRSKKHSALWFTLTNPTSRGLESQPVLFENTPP